MKKILILFFIVFSFAKVYSDDVDWSFPPNTLSTLNVDASDPQIKIDSNGNATAIWVESGNILTSSLPYNGTWSAPVTLANSGMASWPRISVDPNGNVTAVWVDNSVVNTATLPFTGTWSAAQTLSSSGTSSPQVSVDTSGNAVAVWSRGGNIESATKLFAGSWPVAPDVLLSSSADTPQVAIGGGTVVAVWHGVTAGTDTIFSATKLIAGIWGTPQTISSPAHHSMGPRIAVDTNGNALAVWFIFALSGEAYSNVYVESASLPNDGLWSLPIVVSTTAGIYNPASLYVRVGFDGAGNAVAVWNTSFDGVIFYVEGAVLPANGIWSSVTELAIDMYALFVDMAVQSAGAAYIAFTTSDAITNLAIETENTDTSAIFQNVWSGNVVLSSSGIGNAFPRIAVSVNGSTVYAASIWLTANGFNNNVLAITGTQTLLEPPTNLAVAQTTNNFGVVTEYINTLTWQASTSPNVEGYYILRNGIVVDQIVGNITEYIDHNRIQGQVDIYGVAAFDVGAFQSTIATISYP